MYDNYRRLEKIGRHYRAEKLAQAERYRLADQLRPVRAVHTIGFYRPALARLGLILMSIGAMLQKRYGQLNELGGLLEPPTRATEPDKQTGMVG